MSDFLQFRFSDRVYLTVKQVIQTSFIYKIPSPTKTHCANRGGKNRGISDIEDFDIGRIPCLWGVDISNKISVHKLFCINFHSSKFEN